MESQPYRPHSLSFATRCAWPGVCNAKVKTETFRDRLLPMLMNGQVVSTTLNNQEGGQEI